MDSTRTFKTPRATSNKDGSINFRPVIEAYKKSVAQALVDGRMKVEPRKVLMNIKTGESCWFLSEDAERMPDGICF